MAEKEKVEYTQPTSLVDLENRLKNDNESQLKIQGDQNPNPLTDEGFVGVSLEYQNYANDTEKPLASKSGPLKKAEQTFMDEYKEDEAKAKRRESENPSERHYPIESDNKK